MSLSEALLDLKAEVVAGAAVAAVVADIAAEYGLNPKLVERKFFETNTEEGVRAAHKATTKTTADALAEKIAKVCARYRVPVEAVVPVSFKGRNYTAVCRTGSKVVAVSHQDLGAWRLPLQAVGNAF